MMFAGWILIGVLAYVLLKDRELLPREEKGGQAMERLKERFVNGEIDEGTYLKMKNMIQ
ncbi:hypothetical protein [Anaerotalea alkaliphila]|uniref:SHOCT domain-containing protein n=1 Tax=Anaerotalea alkaliphila TaxID=2662126 RepID=A0A7X5HTY0_9FIRM|nr:hypothetical protein [Anaerotalea alkaliphila]NDL66607.1 hypothetical protein [Anaerotalea alkaliphila]